MPAEKGNWTDGIVVKQRYTIASLLGKGGMGEVYRAWDGDLRTDVVIKVPLPETLKNEEFIQRFEREIRSLVRLTHPHIVRITDCGNHRGLPYCVMQFLPGGSLKDRYASQSDDVLRPAPPEELESWLPGVAAALDFIHKENFIHRDVKPANILFDAAGNPYLSDFGIAKVHADQSGGATKGLSLTAQNMVLGTPEYMAPELIMGRNADGRVDQYALAVTVYELLCGQPPFQGQPTAILVMHTGMQPPPLSQFVGGLSPALEQVVLKGMAKNADERYPNCVAFARAVVEAAKSGVVPHRGTMREARPVAPLPPPGFGGLAPVPPGAQVGFAPTPSRGIPTQSMSYPGNATVAEGMHTLGGTIPSHVSAEEIAVAPQPPVKKPLDKRKLAWAGGIAGTILAMIGTFAIGYSGARTGAASALSPEEQMAAVPLARPDKSATFTNALGMTMVCVTPGRFKSGAGFEGEVDGFATIAAPYWISAHEVTVAQYTKFIQSKNEKNEAVSETRRPVWLQEKKKSNQFPPEYDQMGDAFRQNGAPVVGIRVEDAEAFCRWLTTMESKSGLKYRLPSRQEWLCAARAGELTKFPWGDELAKDKFNGPGEDDGQAYLATTGKFAGNAFGLFDMVGNAREMVTSPAGLAGGGWDTAKPEDIVLERFEDGAAPGPSIGFRVVATK